jgi:predicted phosphoribosyltransferase
MASPSGRRNAAPSAPPAFRDRAEAGVLLGAALREILGDLKTGDPERVRADTGRHPVTPELRDTRPVVFAIPRGGVAVAAGVARALGVPLDVIMVRKIGHPAAPELGLGAIAEDGAGGAAEPYFDPEMLSRVGLTADDLDEVVARERAELARRVAVYGASSRARVPGIPGVASPVPAPRAGGSSAAEAGARGPSAEAGARGPSAGEESVPGSSAGEESVPGSPAGGGSVTRSSAAEESAAAGPPGPGSSPEGSAPGSALAGSAVGPPVTGAGEEGSAPGSGLDAPGPAREGSAGPAAAGGCAPEVAGRLVIVVDDGLATGVTARAALRAVRARGAARAVLAVPVAAPAAVSAMERETGEVVTLVTPRRFRSVGEWYADFGQLTDADVLTLLAAFP